MDDSKNQGGAAASLAAHSKDGHEDSNKPKASQADTASGTASRVADRVAAGAEGLADQARDGYERAKSTARDAAQSARDATQSARDAMATHGGQAMDATGRMVREQPLMALAVTGLACFAIGVLVGRRD